MFAHGCRQRLRPLPAGRRPRQPKGAHFHWPSFVRVEWIAAEQDGANKRDERRSPRVTAIFERLTLHGRTERNHDRRELSVVRSPVGLLRPANL